MLRKTLPIVLLLLLLAGCASGASGTQAVSPDSAAPSPPVSEAPVSPSPSPSIEASPSPSAIPISEQLDAIFEDDLFFKGSVLVAKDGEVLFSKGYGMADIDKQITNTPDTVFPIGSVTKQFTAMAVIQLYEKGLLDINDTLSKYLPDFPRGEDITLLQLLTHTSGLVDYANECNEAFNALPLDDITEENLIKLIENKPLNFEPGEQFRYSNTGYLILGCIVEKVSGLSYEDYMRQNIFEPLGMKNSGVIYKDGHRTFSILGYYRNTIASPGVIEGGGYIWDTEKACKGAYGAGALYSTVGDLYLWAEALDTEKLLSKKYMDMIFTSYAGGYAQYGFGWHKKTEGSTGISWYHGGSLPGFSSEIRRYVDKGVTIIILSNEYRIDPSALEYNAIQAVLGM